MRGLAKLFVALLVVAVLAVVADRGADAYAERRAATALAATFGHTPEVSITGTPFLTQWAGGHFDRVAVRADQATVSHTTVRDLSMTLGDVRVPGYAAGADDVRAATAKTVRMSGTVPHGDLPLPKGVKATRAGKSGDKLRLSGHFELLGNRVRFSATVQLAERGGKVDLTPRGVRLLGAGPSAALTNLVEDNLDVRLAPPGLPDGMRLSGLAVTENGLRVTATGRDVQVPRT